MDKVKQKTFSNFGYEIIKSIDERCVDVKCTYKYGDKNLTHYFSYIKSGNKPNSYYIDKAKTEIKSLIASGKFSKVTKKDKPKLTPKGKKRLIVGLSIVGALAVAACVTVTALHFTANRGSSDEVSEAEIDKYLAAPSGKSVPVSELGSQIIFQQALKNITNISPRSSGNSIGDELASTNLSNVDIKILSSYNYYDGFGNLYHEDQFEAEDAQYPNDLSGYFVNDVFKQKKYYGTSISAKLTKNKTTLDITAKDKLYQSSGGNEYLSNVTTRDIFTYSEYSNNGSNAAYYPFIYSKFDFDGYTAPNLESYAPLADNTYEKEVINNMFIETAIKFVGDWVNFKKITTMLKQSQLFRAEDGTVYLFNTIERLHGSIPSTINPGKYEPMYGRQTDMWRFKETKDLGWVLESYAADTLPTDLVKEEGSSGLYVYNNERGEALDKPYCVNKAKMVVKLKYGECEQTTKEVNDITFKKNQNFIGKDFGAAYFYKDEQEAHGDYLPIKNLTLVRRIEDKKFDGTAFNVAVYNNDNRMVNEGDGAVFSARNQIDDETLEVTLIDWNVMKNYLSDSAKTLVKEGRTFTVEGSITITTCEFTRYDGWYSFDFCFDKKFDLESINVQFIPGQYVDGIL